VTIDDIMRYKEKGGLNNDWDCTLAIVRDGGNNQAIDKIKEIFEMIYSRCMDRERLLIDKSFFESLRSKYRIGLVTGRPKKDALYASEKFSLGFDVMITLDDVEKGKPDPEGIRKALEKISPDQRSGGNAIYIGDTVDDVIAAAAAGIPCIGISRKKEVLMRAGARIVLDDVNQLKGFLEGNLGGNE